MYISIMVSFLGPEQMVEAQAGMRLSSESEPCLTALSSFYLSARSSLQARWWLSLDSRDSKTRRRDTRAIQI
jgi:hypothetical protein